MIKQPKIISKEGFLKAETLRSGTVSQKAESNLRWWAKRIPILVWDKAQNPRDPQVPPQLQLSWLGCGNVPEWADPGLPPDLSRLFSCIPEEHRQLSSCFPDEVQGNSSIPLLLPGITPTCMGFLYTVIRVQRRLPWERVKENDQKLPQKLLPMKVQANADNYLLILTRMKGILAISSTETLN